MTSQAEDEEKGRGQELLSSAKELKNKVENLDGNSNEDLAEINRELESLIEDIAKLNKKEEQRDRYSFLLANIVLSK